MLYRNGIGLIIKKNFVWIFRYLNFKIQNTRMNIICKVQYFYLIDKVMLDLSAIFQIIFTKMRIFVNICNIVIIITIGKTYFYSDFYFIKIHTLITMYDSMGISWF